MTMVRDAQAKAIYFLAACENSVRSERILPAGLP
jgi:hypothetical protein